MDRLFGIVLIVAGAAVTIFFREFARSIDDFNEKVFRRPRKEKLNQAFSLFGGIASIVFGILLLLGIIETGASHL